MGPTQAQTRVDNCVGSFVSYCDDSDSHDGGGYRTGGILAGKRSAGLLYGPAGYKWAPAAAWPMASLGTYRYDTTAKSTQSERVFGCSDSYLSACFG